MGTGLGQGDSLDYTLETIINHCIKCGLCQKECEFLRRYGTPKEIAETYSQDDANCQTIPFECSLCCLCAAVCPKEINPADMFLQMRRNAAKQKDDITKKYSGILGYEKRGTSKLYTWYSLPENCNAVFFPGCTLPGTRPKTTLKIFYYLKEHISALGIVLDCCTKPSHDLGRDSYFHDMFGEMKNFLLQHGVTTVFVACPNCFKVFTKYGGDLQVQTVYEYMADKGMPPTKIIDQTVTVHDPCSLRFETTTHNAIRQLIERQGIHVNEMVHSKGKTLCCGEGGSVSCVSPELSTRWATSRKQESNGNRVITYCAGCANQLGKHMPTLHILDLMFQAEAAIHGKIKVSQAPITYINRLRLKRHFKKNMQRSVVRERVFQVEENNAKGKNILKIFILLIIIAGIIAFRMTGALQYLEKDTLRNMIEGYGMLAPFIYMLIYAIAPSLFMPGLPITLAGGILFGAFWGVVYSITGATVGACVAFLVSRYLARDWVASKLRSPGWQRLDNGVERHGWKVVAFTRLVPLFPFNLLNYAFGLTKIKFIHYAVTTFITMLPACIAFIVFSSSLLDVLNGKISLKFIAGVFLIILVSLIPFFYKRYKERKKTEPFPPARWFDRI
jgi:uncharacterized membrane protein YdjX (TVP38/TMEM64 family)/Fe-S oxidoreductase